MNNHGCDMWDVIDVIEAVLSIIGVIAGMVVAVHFIAKIW